MPKTSSYDVCFNPMVNVSVSVKDPKHPTEKELETIIKTAAQALLEQYDDKVNGENVALIRLYETDIRKGPDSTPTTIFVS